MTSLEGRAGVKGDTHDCGLDTWAVEILSVETEMKRNRRIAGERSVNVGMRCS